MSACHPEVFVDHESDLSATKESVFFELSAPPSGPSFCCSNSGQCASVLWRSSHQASPNSDTIDRQFTAMS